MTRNVDCRSTGMVRVEPFTRGIGARKSVEAGTGPGVGNAAGSVVVSTEYPVNICRRPSRLWSRVSASTSPRHVSEPDASRRWTL